MAHAAVLERAKRVTALVTAATLLLSQFTFPQTASASHLGSSTQSAGSAPPPAATAIESFQPDLFTGRATTSIPIAVPPGRKGVQPGLALAYSSSSRNSWVGVGWGLDVGYVERSTKNGVPKYDSSDTFTFMFQGITSELVQIPDGTYRAKDEGLFLRFENHGASGWEVRDKAGTRYRFGQTASSRLESAGQIFRWCLDNVLDLNGNTLTLTYTNDQGQLYLAQIAYTGHEIGGTQDLAPANSVQFTTEARPDVETSYRSGFAITTAKRLKEVAAYAQGQLAHRYALTYTPSQRTNRSLLTSVQQFGTDGTTSLPPVTFTYQDTGSATYPNLLSNSVPPPSVAGWNVRKAGLDTGNDNFGCVHPYSGLPWDSPIQTTGGFDLGCLSGSVSGNGDISMNGCQDHFGHAYVFVYTGTAKSISVSLSGSEVDGCLWREDSNGVQQFPGNNLSVPLQAGWSIIHLTGYNQNEGWSYSLTSNLKSQVDVMNPSQIPLGVPQLAGDVNGDAKTDIIKFNPQNGSWSVSCATSCTLPPPGTWLSGFGNSSSIPLLGDWNGDGRTDIAIYDGGSWQFATSTGSSFQANSIGGLSFGSGTPLIGDFNGDGNTDLGTYNNGSWSVALWNGNGFSSTGSFSVSWGGSSFNPLTGDFNGDGLTDIGIVDNSSGTVEIRLATGSGWTSPATWISNFGGSNPHTAADFNGDGLTDAVYYNRSAGQVIYAPSTGSSFGSSSTLPLSFSLTSSDDQIQVGDFNGDSIADPAVFNILSGSSQLALSSLTNPDGSNGTATDVLRTIHNGLGGVTTLTYQPSTLCGCGQDPLLPFIVQVVQRAKQEDGLGHSYTTTYLFHGGLYDAPTKEFRGFEEATVFDIDGNKSVTEFHQDAQKKGRPFRSQFLDASGTLWTQADQTWSSTEPYPGVFFVTLDQADSTTTDGDATSKQTRGRFQYDQYGNVIRTDADGEVGVTGDERSAVTTFVYNTTDWILSKPALTQTLDGAGTVVAQNRFTYDNAPDSTTPPTLGNLTTEEEWLNWPTGATGPTGSIWLPTTLTYDSFGNVKTVTDALDRTTTNAYEATASTFLAQITNVLGHSRKLSYDPRTGQVLTSTDQNSVTTTTQYDAIGRVAAVIGPNDTAALPTIRYVYDPCLTSGQQCPTPIKTTACARIQSGQAQELCTDTYTDGLGRTIQTRAPAEDPTKQVVGGAVEFNTKGQVIKQWVPYLDGFSSSYVPVSQVSGLTSPVLYSYDPLGRALSVTDPDGAVSTTSYNDWTTTATDALGHQTRHVADAYGRLVNVEELNQGQTYTTNFQYDALNNLTAVTDHAGNVTTNTYDSLSRKRSMQDPDMGAWSYTYDAVDNLLTQTDARGITIIYAYDPLNRLTQKSYSGTQSPSNPVTYTYDDALTQTQLFARGRLTDVTESSDGSRFEYDNLGRLITETKTLDGTTYTISRAYDLLGRLTTLTYPDGDVVTYTYNNQGGIETIALQSQVSGLLSLVSNVDYNAAGQILTIAYGNGVVSDYTYNPLTLRLDQLQSTGPAGLIQHFQYAFDAVGNVQSITDYVHTGSQTFGYDDLNRLTSASGAYGAFSYAYDPLGNMTDKEGVTMTYGENGVGPHALTSAISNQQSAISYQMSYDANGNMLAKTPQDPNGAIIAQRLQYDAENHLIQADTPSQETVTVTLKPGWNFFSLPVIPTDSSIATLFPNFSVDFEQIAKYDPSTLNPSPFTHYVGNPKFDDFSSLTYGEGYELYCTNPTGLTVSFTGQVPTQSLNQSLATGWQLLSSITTGDKNETVGQIFAGIASNQVLRYDTASGSLTSVAPSDVATLGASYYVEVLSASTWTPPLPVDVTTTTGYDGDGGRTTLTTAAGTTRFLGESVEFAPDGTTTKYVFAGSQRVAAWETTPQQQAMLRAQRPRSLFAKAWQRLREWLVPTAEAAALPGLRFYLTDHLGSSNLVTDGTGAIVQQLEYTPYGSVSVNFGSVDVAHKFTGQLQDTQTGLILFPARAYDPQLGRFLQPDPFVQNPADPQTLDRYSYVRNNPINLVDPSGYIFGWDDLIYWAIWAVILTAEGVYLYNNWPFNQGFDPSILKDTGIRFLQSLAPPGQLLNQAGQPFDLQQAIDLARSQGGRLRIFVNGIQTDATGASAQARSQLGDPLTVYYNPSAGTIPDLVESAVEYLLGPTDIDRGLARILNQLAEAGVPVDIFAFSQGGLIVLNAALAGAQFASGSTVRLFSSPISEARLKAALPETVKGTVKPTAFFDPINTLQGLSELAFSGFPALPGNLDARLRILGGMLGLAKDRFTGLPTAHKLPDDDAGTSP